MTDVRDGPPEWTFDKRHGFLTPIVSEVHQSGPWGQVVDGRPSRVAGLDF